MYYEDMKDKETPIRRKRGRPKKVKTPCPKAKIFNPKNVNQHEVKKENDVYLTPIDN